MRAKVTDFSRFARGMVSSIVMSREKTLTDIRTGTTRCDQLPNNALHKIPSYPNGYMKFCGIQGQSYKCLPSQKTNKVNQNYWCKESFLLRKRMWKNDMFSLVKYHIPIHPLIEIIFVARIVTYSLYIE